MKTAISLPDDVFVLSEKIAKKLKISRSAVFVLGIEKLNEELERDALTKRINEVCEKADTSLDPTVRSYTARRLGKNKW